MEFQMKNHAYVVLIFMATRGNIYKQVQRHLTENIKTKFLAVVSSSTRK